MLGQSKEQNQSAHALERMSQSLSGIRHLYKHLNDSVNFHTKLEAALEHLDKMVTDFRVAREIEKDCMLEDLGFELGYSQFKSFATKPELESPEKPGGPKIDKYDKENQPPEKKEEAKFEEYAQKNGPIDLMDVNAVSQIVFVPKTHPVEKEVKHSYPEGHNQMGNIDQLLESDILSQFGKLSH